MREIEKERQIKRMTYGRRIQENRKRGKENGGKEKRLIEKAQEW